MKTELIQKLQKAAEKMRPNYTKMDIHREHFMMQVQARPQTSRSASTKGSAGQKPVVRHSHTSLLLTLLVIVAISSIGIRYPDAAQSLYATAKETVQQATVWLNSDIQETYFTAPAKPDTVNLRSEPTSTPEAKPTTTPPRNTSEKQSVENKVNSFTIKTPYKAKSTTSPTSHVENPTVLSGNKQKRTIQPVTVFKNNKPSVTPAAATSSAARQLHQPQ